jgi:quercetin dioxygenase-like cupin family protein
MTTRLVRDAGVAEQVTFDEANGSPALLQTILRVAPGTTSARTAGSCDEILYVLSGTGALELDGARHELSEASGAQLRPGEEYRLQADDGAPLVLVSSRSRPKGRGRSSPVSTTRTPRRRPPTASSGSWPNPPPAAAR